MTDHVLAVVSGLIGGVAVAVAAYVHFIHAERKARP